MGPVGVGWESYRLFLSPSFFGLRISNHPGAIDVSKMFSFLTSPIIIIVLVSLSQCNT